MTSTDVSEVTSAVDGIKIDGPAAPDETQEAVVSEPEVYPAHTSDERVAAILGNESAGETTVEITTSDGETTGPVPLAALETALTPTPSKEALFATDKYLAVPTIDGQAADLIKISFTGGVEYEASDPDGQELLNRLRLGQEVELRVAAVVARKAGSWKTVGKEDEEREVVTGQVALKVTSLWRLAPEDLA